MGDKVWNQTRRGLVEESPKFPEQVGEINYILFLKIWVIWVRARTFFWWERYKQKVGSPQTWKYPGFMKSLGLSDYLKVAQPIWPMVRFGRHPVNKNKLVLGLVRDYFRFMRKVSYKEGKRKLAKLAINTENWFHVSCNWRHICL